MNIGDVVVDEVTGWTGTVTGRFEWLGAYVTCEVTGRDNYGMPKSFTFHEARLTAATAADRHAAGFGP